MGSFLLPCAATGVSLLAVWCLSGATLRGVAVDVCRDTPAGVRRAERAADGGVVDVPRALAVGSALQVMLFLENPIWTLFISIPSPFKRG